jgi:prepilin-type N-terminal cleavage/methylation domain-containing protein
MKIKIKGFTLIELLVVISIIGILAALATVSFSSTQKQTKDVQRKSDLKQYQNAIEVFGNQNNGMYPEYSASTKASTTLCTTLAMSVCPEDPKYSSDNSFYYQYQSDGSLSTGVAQATDYVLWTKLENAVSMYWVVCSTGQSGKIASSTSISGGACPSGLTP